MENGKCKMEDVHHHHRTYAISLYSNLFELNSNCNFAKYLSKLILNNFVIRKTNAVFCCCRCIPICDAYLQPLFWKFTNELDGKLCKSARISIFKWISTFFSPFNHFRSLNHCYYNEFVCVCMWQMCIDWPKSAEELLTSDFEFSNQLLTDFRAKKSFWRISSNLYTIFT